MLIAIVTRNLLSMHADERLSEGIQSTRVQSVDSAGLRLLWNKKVEDSQSKSQRWLLVYPHIHGELAVN
jgi:hypothetical protein